MCFLRVREPEIVIAIEHKAQCNHQQSERREHELALLGIFAVLFTGIGMLAFGPLLEES